MSVESKQMTKEKRTRSKTMEEKTHYTESIIYERVAFESFN